MTKITYLTRLCKNEFSLSEQAFNFKIDIPRFCPLCQMPQRGTFVDKKQWNIDNNQQYLTAMYTCNNCGKKYLTNFSLNPKEKTGHFGSFYPVLTVSYENELIKSVSPRFIELYNQALNAEYANNIDLAATGYRNALECLVKDYAIRLLKEDPESVKHMSLFDAIGAYLKNDLVVSADVVRILGNDYTHYERKYSDIDFQVLKNYMEIFINLMETRIRLSDPPVSRR